MPVSRALEVRASSRTARARAAARAGSSPSRGSSLGVRHPDVDVQPADSLPPRATGPRTRRSRGSARRARSPARTECWSDTSPRPRRADRAAAAISRAARRNSTQALDRLVRGLARRPSRARRPMRAARSSARPAALRPSAPATSCSTAGHELERLRVEDPELLLDADGQGARRSAARSTRADAVDRAAGRLPRVVGRARAERLLVRLRCAGCGRPPSRAARDGGGSDRPLAPTRGSGARRS